MRRRPSLLWVIMSGFALHMPSAGCGSVLERASDVEQWLFKLFHVSMCAASAAKAEQHACGFISDAQSGIRESQDRGKPIDEKALEDLMKNVYESRLCWQALPADEKCGILVMGNASVLDPEHCRKK